MKLNSRHSNRQLPPLLKVPDKYFTTQTKVYADRAIDRPIPLLDDVPHRPEDALMCCFRLTSTQVNNQYRMSEEGRSTFAEALTRFSMTSKDYGSESEEEHSEELQAHKPESLSLEEVEMMRIKSAPNDMNSSLEGKESPELQ